MRGEWIGVGSPRMPEGEFWVKRRIGRKELREAVINLIAHSYHMDFYNNIVTIIMFIKIWL